ncbi:hypothetical protein [Streptomyces zagrosensis]|uniref:PASTA domain-containing protein n=1 Tax=Streptomyces zagrosensis TaxID=1042984 RepID=A0A7W9QA72_9ACTN|nr:hypothetical protein [Streptomyces zagrosensis]MBB5936234.1 hypothetical protein [Streptomyces zagrosensis]
MSDYPQQPTDPNWGPPPSSSRPKTRKQKILISVGVTFGALMLIGTIGAITDNDGDDNTSAERKATERVATPDVQPTEPAASPTPEASPTTHKPATKAPTPAAEATTETADDVAAAALPHLVGKQLQAAQDAAQEAGFYNLTSHDATGDNRFQVYDRNWIVCSQTPGPGTQSLTTQVDFGAVKDSETCP